MYVAIKQRYLFYELGSWSLETVLKLEMMFVSFLWQLFLHKTSFLFFCSREKLRLGNRWDEAEILIYLLTSLWLGQ